MEFSGDSSPVVVYLSSGERVIGPVQLSVDTPDEDWCLDFAGVYILVSGCRKWAV